jgi:hypothetical protein
MAELRVLIWASGLTPFPNAEGLGYELDAAPYGDAAVR